MTLVAAVTVVAAPPSSRGKVVEKAFYSPQPKSMSPLAIVYHIDIEVYVFFFATSFILLLLLNFFKSENIS